MWTSFWNGPESTEPSPSQPRADDDNKPGNHCHGGGRHMKGAAAAADRDEHVGSKPSAEYTTILRGVIVGEEQSGKTCLIRRLRGEDPFQQNERAAKNANRRSHRNLMALIPWKVPESAAFRQKNYHEGSDDLVQLYVSEGNSFCYSQTDISYQKQWMSVLRSQRGKECDFVVWMIDPRMDNVLDFLREGLEVLVPSTAQESDADGDKDSAEIFKHPLVQNLCILLNFRDSTKQNNSDQSPLVEQMKLVVEQVITSHKEYYEKQRQRRMADTTTLTILVYESSMKDCYGLKNLFSFINLPYFSRKEREFERLAENARKQHSQWKQEIMASKGIEYDEFLKQTRAQQKQSPKQSTERQRLEEEKEQLQRCLRQQSPLQRSEKQIRGETCASVKKQLDDGEDGTASALVISPPGRSEKNGEQDVALSTLNDTVKRKLFAKSRPSSVERKDLYDNLDSFFSDDEDDAQSETNDSSDDDSEGDDSDDGDFYIDVSGTRCAHGNTAAGKRTEKSSLNRIHKVIPNIYRVNEGVTTEDDSDRLDDKHEIGASSPKEEQSSSMKKMGEDKVNDGKLELLKPLVTDAGKVEEEVEDQCACDSMGDDASKPNLRSQNADVVTSSDETRADHAGARESTLVPEKDERLRISSASVNQDIDNKQYGTSIVETTSTNFQDAKDEPEASGADCISANGDSHGAEEDNDDNATNQIAESVSKAVCIGGSNGREDVEDREDIDENETQTTTVKIDKEHQELPAIETLNLVLDSDEEDSIEGKADDRKNNPRAECVGRDAEPTCDVTRPSHRSISASPSLSNQTSAPAKSLAVSSAARAAIEAARLEAERMIARSRSDDNTPDERREKKSKKSKDGEKKKKKKKDKRRDG
ncbi:hypothetical protein ACHAW5_003302 [Stephanodiscus triporus]|uniref:Dynein light intermediate chain n=1 Tax=Stephanodiscus triporus TaxID=2934178 RepID=A0ABD3QB79_9STRA